MKSLESSTVPLRIDFINACLLMDENGLLMRENHPYFLKLLQIGYHVTKYVPRFECKMCFHGSHAWTLIHRWWYHLEMLWHILKVESHWRKLSLGTDYKVLKKALFPVCSWFAYYIHSVIMCLMLLPPCFPSWWTVVKISPSALELLLVRCLAIEIRKETNTTCFHLYLSYYRFRSNHVPLQPPTSRACKQNQDTK